MEGVLALARSGGELAQRFARFVQDNLCETESASAAERKSNVWPCRHKRVAVPSHTERPHTCNSLLMLLHSAVLCCRKHVKPEFGK